MSEYVSRAAHFGRVPESLLANKTLSSDAKVLYAFLTTFDYRRTGVAGPSREHMAERLGWSVRTVSRYLSELVEVGAIIRRKGGDGATTVTELAADVLSEVPDVAGLEDSVVPKRVFSGATTEKRTSYRTRENEKRRKRRPSSDFEPTDSHKVYAKSEGLDLTAERDHWLVWCEANGKSYSSVNAGFSTWLRQAVEFGRGSTNGGRRSRVDFDALQ